jgi:hypothetical protein
VKEDITCTGVEGVHRLRQLPHARGIDAPAGEKRVEVERPSGPKLGPSGPPALLSTGVVSKSTITLSKLPIKVVPHDLARWRIWVPTMIHTASWGAPQLVAWRPATKRRIITETAQHPVQPIRTRPKPR